MVHLSVCAIKTVGIIEITDYLLINFVINCYFMVMSINYIIIKIMPFVKLITLHAVYYLLFSDNTQIPNAKELSSRRVYFIISRYLQSSRIPTRL